MSSDTLVPRTPHDIDPMSHSACLEALGLERDALPSAIRAAYLDRTADRRREGGLPIRRTDGGGLSDLDAAYLCLMDGFGLAAVAFLHLLDAPCFPQAWRPDEPRPVGATRAARARRSLRARLGPRALR